MAVASVGLAFGAVRLDSSLSGRKLATSIGFLWSGGADGARSLLSMVASSMITVAGTVFSITITALVLASGQFGPRLLRNFTRDLGNQVVLGTFVATFLYCLLVLRTVRGAQEGDFVPYFSVTLGVLSAAASIGVLIYFIHHIAASIQAENLIAVVGAELKQNIARLYPAHPDTDAEHRPLDVPSSPAGTVRAEASGYVQTLDSDGLVAIGETNDLLVQALRRPGDFVSRGDALLLVWTNEGELAKDQAGQMRDAFSLGTRRTPTQDMRYGIRQLTEIASRALSPGINDPFTAMGCTDWLMDALADAARMNPAPGCRRDAEGARRLLQEPVGFAELARLSVDPVRVYGADSAIVMAHLLRSLARIAAQVEREEDRAALLTEAELTAAAAREALRNEADLRRVNEELDGARAAARRGAGKLCRPLTERGASPDPQVLPGRAGQGRRRRAAGCRAGERRLFQRALERPGAGHRGAGHARRCAARGGPRCLKRVGHPGACDRLPLNANVLWSAMQPSPEADSRRSDCCDAAPISVAGGRAMQRCRP